METILDFCVFSWKLLQWMVYGDSLLDFCVFSWELLQWMVYGDSLLDFCVFSWELLVDGLWRLTIRLLFFLMETITLVSKVKHSNTTTPTHPLTLKLPSADTQSQ
jgi:hypothetical protein